MSHGSLSPDQFGKFIPQNLQPSTDYPMKYHWGDRDGEKDWKELSPKIAKDSVMKARRWTIADTAK